MRYLVTLGLDQVKYNNITLTWAYYKFLFILETMPNSRLLIIELEWGFFFFGGGDIVSLLFS